MSLLSVTSLAVLAASGVGRGTVQEPAGMRASPCPAPRCALTSRAASLRRRRWGTQVVCSRDGWVGAFTTWCRRHPARPGAFSIF